MNCVELVSQTLINKVYWRLSRKIGDVLRNSPCFISDDNLCSHVEKSDSVISNIWLIINYLFLSPYLLIVFHGDLTTVFGAHSAHLFADDLNVLIRPPIFKNVAPIIEYLEREGTKICNQISEYAWKWKQPINVSKTVAQIFFWQVTIPRINIIMDGQKIKVVKSFKYLDE